MVSSGQVEPNQTKRIQLLAGYAIAIASIVFALRYLRVNTDHFLLALAGIELWRVGLAASLFLLVLAMNACAFAAAGRAFGMPISSRVLCAAWLSSLLAKYIPVGVGHVAGRGVVLASRGVSWRSIVATGVFEQAVSLLWCMLIAWSFHVMLPIASFAVVVPASLILGFMSVFVFRKMGFAVNGLASSGSVLLYSVAMLPYAIGYLVLVDPRDVFGFMSALFAGTVAGVLAIVSPGGLGVRESVTTAAASGEAGGVLAGLLVARIVILATEICGSLLGGWWIVRGDRTNGD